MKSNIRKRLLCLLLVCTLSILMGCGGSENDDKKEDTTTVKTRIVVEDLVENNQGLNKYIKQRQNAFSQENPDIEVEHVASSTSDFTNQISDTKKALDVNSSLTPTMVLLNTNEYARQLYEDGYAADITEYVSSWSELSSFYENVLEGYTYNEKIIGFPVEIETPTLGFNKSILEERKDELSAIGQDYTNLSIKSWDDYEKIVEVLTYSNEKGTSIYGMGFTSQDYYQSFGVWATSNAFDGVVQNDDGTIDISFKDNTSMTETLEMFNELWSKKIIMENGIDATSANYFRYIWTGRIASFTYYPQWANWFSQSGNMAISDVDIYNFPVGNYAKSKGVDNTAIIYAKGYIISSKATEDQIKACVKYLEFMYSKETWEEKIDFAYENYCDFVTYPALKDVDLTNVYANIDEVTGSSNYSDTIRYALQYGYVGNINNSSYTVEIRAKLSSLIQAADKGEISSMLGTLESTTKANWLDNYNESKRKK